jgi:hypothetical protein
MPVLVEHIAQPELNGLIWLGRVTRAQALAMPARIDPAQPRFGARWISYFDATADLSDLDAACLIELRERLRPVVVGLAAKGPFQMVLASNSSFNDFLIAAWRAMVGPDSSYPSNPVIVRDLDSAARALGLSAGEAEQARTWIEARVAKAAHAPGS